MRPSRADIDERKDDLADLMDASSSNRAAFWEKLELSWVYHENALEGIVITPEEMTQAFQPTLAVTEVSKAQFLADIRRQKKAIQFAQQEASNPKGKISATLVKDLFETLTGGEEGRGKIEYRKDMPLHRTYFHDIAQPPRIVPDLMALIEWTDTAEFRHLHPLQQAALFHHKFMAIFPFTELSGKVGRLLMNIIIMRAGYVPAVIHAIDRQKYYDSLKQQPRVLQHVLTDAIEHVTDLGFKWFTAGAQPTSRARAG